MPPPAPSLPADGARAGARRRHERACGPVRAMPALVAQGPDLAQRTAGALDLAAMNQGELP